MTVPCRQRLKFLRPSYDGSKSVAPRWMKLPWLQLFETLGCFVGSMLDLTQLFVFRKRTPFLLKPRSCRSLQCRSIERKAKFPAASGQLLAEFFGGREYRFLAGLKKWSSVSHKLLEW